jgi:hypothetical protein
MRVSRRSDLFRALDNRRDAVLVHWNIGYFVLCRCMRAVIRIRPAACGIFEVQTKTPELLARRKKGTARGPH